MKTTGLIGFLITGLLLSSCSKKLYHLITTSPGNIYRVELVEVKSEISSQDTFPYKVFLTVDKNKTQIINNEKLYYGDVWDTRFGVIAPMAEWMDEKIVRLARRHTKSIEHFDSIDFHNESTQLLDYVFISWTVSNPNPNESFVLVDIEPDEKINLQITSGLDNADLSVISCQGRFRDGTRFGKTTKNFTIKGKYQSPSRYSVTVKDDKILLDSQEYPTLK